MGRFKRVVLLLVSLSFFSHISYAETLKVGECTPLLTSKKYLEVKGSFSEGKAMSYSCDFTCMKINKKTETVTAVHKIKVYSLEDEGRLSVCMGVKMKEEVLPWNGKTIWNVDHLFPVSALYSFNKELMTWAFKENLHLSERVLEDLHEKIKPSLIKLNLMVEGKIIPFMSNDKDRVFYEEISEHLELLIHENESEILATFFGRYLSGKKNSLSLGDSKSFAYQYFLEALEEAFKK